MTNRSFLAASLLVAACLTGWTCISGTPSVAGPLDPEANTDGFSPASEIDEINENRRRDLIARQWDLNLQFYGWGGYGYGPPYVDRFTPWWQGVPGNMWSYRQQWRIEQPIGHESVQTGPNRWTYRPLYEGEELPAPGLQDPATSSRMGPQLPGPSDLMPQAGPLTGRPMKAKRRLHGPRGF